MASPLVPQGTLNRLRASVSIPLMPQLNVTAPFLGEEGVNVNFEGNVTDPISTMTGTVNSPAPYLLATVEIELLKTQVLSNLYKRQLEVNSVLGDFVVRPDSSTLSPYTIQNGSIMSAGPGRLNGRSVGFMVTLQGYYLVNSNLYLGN